MGLRKFRIANQISQKVLSEYLGITQSYLSQIESGARPLNDKIIQKLNANKLGWDVEPLADKEDLKPGVRTINISSYGNIASFTDAHVDNSGEVIGDLNVTVPRTGTIRQSIENAYLKKIEQITIAYEKKISEIKSDYEKQLSTISAKYERLEEECLWLRDIVKTIHSK